MATLLMVVALAVIIAFAMAGGSMLNLNVVYRASNNSDARNLADSVIARAIEDVIQQEQNGTARDTTLVITVPDDVNASGVLSYDDTGASLHKIPKSTYNMVDSVGKGYLDRILPAFSVHLIGVGRCKNAEQMVEAIVHMPPFPYCVATSGTFTAKNDLLIASVKHKEDMIENPTGLQPGNLLSNSNSDTAVQLNGTGTITGDVQTAGKVVNTAVSIYGDVRCNDPAVFPKAPPYISDMSSFDPDPDNNGKIDIDNDGTDDADVTVDPDPSSFPAEWTGFYKFNDSLSVSGDLVLKGVRIYVTKSLTVTGGVKGTGALIVREGPINILGNATVSSENLVALMCGGDVTINGSGKDSYFQGVVCTKGNVFSTSNISIFGAFIQEGSAMSNITLDNVYFYGVTEYVKELKKGFTAELGGGGPTPTPPKPLQIGNPRTESLDGTDLDLTTLKSTDINWKNNFDSLFGLYWSKWSPVWKLELVGTDSYTLTMYKTETDMNNNNVLPGYVTPPPMTSSQVADKLKRFYQDSGTSDEFGMWTKFVQKYYPADIMSFINNCRVGSGMQKVKNWTDFYLSGSGTVNNWEVISEYVAASPGTPSAPKTVFSLDINEFLQKADRMRVLLWKRI